jgi:hypothetical protein
LAAAGLAAGAVIALPALLPVRAPDAKRAPIVSVLDFALLDRDFNGLPLDERLALLRDLMARLRTMSAGDSALMAAFAAGVTGAAREQLETNVERLMVDLLDRHASAYAAAAEEDKEAAIEAAMLEMLGLTGELAEGEADPSAARARLEEIRRAAKEDAQRAAERGVDYDPVRMVESYKMFQRGIGRHSTPQQQAKIQLFFRGATRWLRGQPVDGG